MHRIISILIIFVISITSLHSEEYKFIGILENQQTRDPKTQTTSRVLFYKHQDIWKAFGASHGSKQMPEIDSKIKWIATKDGKQLNTVHLAPIFTSEDTHNDWFYRRNQIFKILPIDGLPQIKNKENSFSGWLSTPEYIPIIISSSGTFKITEHWESFKPEMEIKETLFPFLRVIVGNQYLTRSVYEPNYHSEPYDFKSSETVIYEAYKVSNQRMIVCIGLDLNVIRSDGPSPSNVRGQWFLIDSDRIEYFGREMELIDTGDFDDDGSLEFLFWHSGYNEDGYVLVYDNFKRFSEYKWSYH